MNPMATAEFLGNIGEFLGAIGVLVTLVYLAIQVRHGKEATEANTRLAEQNHALALAQNQIARVGLIAQQVRSLGMSNELAEIFVKAGNHGTQALDDVEMRRFQSWHIAQHYILDSQHYQYTLGLLDEDSWQDAVRRIEVSIDTWDRLDMTLIGRAAFTAEVDRIRTSVRQRSTAQTA